MTGNNRVHCRVTARMRASAAALLLLILAPACDRKPAPEAAPAVSQAPAPVPAVSSSPRVDLRHAPVERVEVPEVRVRPKAPTKVHVAWLAPKGTAVNDDAPFRVRWNRSDGLAEAPPDVKATGSSAKDGFDVTVQPLAGTPNATLAGEIALVVCDAATHSVCVPVRRSVELGFVAASDAAAEARIEIPLPEARPQ